jgi:hypothetical protein
MKLKVKLVILLMLMSLSALSYAALDLKFSSAITLSPAAPNLGDTVIISVSFKSAGDAVTNMKIIGGIDGVQLYERDYASIQANGSRTDSFTWTAAGGNHTAFFTLDPNHTAGDSVYSNNHLEKPFTVTGGTSISWETGAFMMTPASPKGGDTVTFNHTFKVTLGPVDNLKLIMGYSGIPKYGHTYAHLDAGASIPVSLDIPGVAAISTTVFFQLDPDQTTNDVNFSDNRFEYTFTPQNVGTQLLWQNNTFTMTPAAPTFGNSIIFKMDYRVANAPVDNLKIVAKLDGVKIKETDVAHKEPSWNNPFAAGWTAMKTGNHTLDLILDPNQTTGDSDYSDNSYQYTFNIPANPPGSAPNLTIKKLAIKPIKLYYNSGDNVKICFSIVNTGTIASPSAQVTISRDGIVFVNYQGTGILNPGQSFSPCENYTVDCKQIEIKIDPANKVNESNESDNAWSHNFCSKSFELQQRALK